MTRPGDPIFVCADIRRLLQGTGNNLDLLDTFLLFGDPATPKPIYHPTAVTHTISGNTGTGSASLSYEDGPLQSATSAPDGCLSCFLETNVPHLYRQLYCSE